MYDFSNVAPAAVGNYLEPGLHKVRIKEAKAIASKKNNTPGLQVTFTNKEGQTVSPTFYLTDNTLDRFQYLHTGWLGKNIDSSFKSADELLAFFVKALTSKTAKNIVKVLLVSGNIAENGRVFSDIPYAGFIIEDENVQLGEFDKDSKEYKKYVVPSNMTNESTGKKNGILNNDEEEEEEEKPKGKGGKTKEKEPVKNGKGISENKGGKKPVEEPKEEEDEDEEEGEDPIW